MTSDVDLDHLVEVMSARCLQHKFTIFPFVIMSVLWRDNFQMMQTSCFSYYDLLVLASLVILACKNYYCSVCQVVIFHSHHFFYIY